MVSRLSLGTWYPTKRQQAFSVFLLIKDFRRRIHISAELPPQRGLLELVRKGNVPQLQHVSGEIRLRAFLDFVKNLSGAKITHARNSCKLQVAPGNAEERENSFVTLATHTGMVAHAISK